MLLTPLHPLQSGFFPALHHKTALVNVWTNGPLPPSWSILSSCSLCIIFSSFPTTSLHLFNLFCKLIYLNVISLRSGPMLTFVFHTLLGSIIQPLASIAFSRTRALKWVRPGRLPSLQPCVHPWAAISLRLGPFSMSVCQSISAS